MGKASGGPGGEKLHLFSQGFSKEASGGRGEGFVSGRGGTFFFQRGIEVVELDSSEGYERLHGGCMPVYRSVPRTSEIVGVLDRQEYSGL